MIQLKPGDVASAETLNKITKHLEVRIFAIEQYLKNFTKFLEDTQATLDSIADVNAFLLKIQTLETRVTTLIDSIAAISSVSLSEFNATLALVDALEDAIEALEEQINNYGGGGAADVPFTVHWIDDWDGGEVITAAVGWGYICNAYAYETVTIRLPDLSATAEAGVKYSILITNIRENQIVEVLANYGNNRFSNNGGTVLNVPSDFGYANTVEFIWGGVHEGVGYWIPLGRTVEPTATVDDGGWGVYT